MEPNLFNQPKWRKNIIYGGAVILVLIIGASTYYLGYQTGAKNPETFIVKGITNLGDDDVTADFSIFWQALKTLKDEHLRGDQVSDKEFVDGAISGLTSPFKDENTIYLPKEDAKKFEEDISGRFGRIGAEIGLRDEQLVVVAPLKKSPAERAGLKPLDKILKIDDLDTTGITVDAAVKRIRGAIDTTVTLNIFRNGWRESKDFTITRKEIVVPTLDWELTEPDRFVHIKLHSFNENAATAFYEAGIDALTNRARGIILDLRNNPGGLLEVAINLAGWFVNRGEVVVKEDFRGATDRVFRANGNGAFKELPVVVIQNKGSASASEILAGALRDLRGVKIVGETSFGKGTVQELHSLKDDSKLKITVANWVLPSGEPIEKKGLKPDIEVKLTDADAEAKRDPQLEKAIEVLKQELADQR